MRKLVSLLLTLVLSIGLYSANVSLNQAHSTGFNIGMDNTQELVMSYEVGSLTVEKMKNKRGEFSSISFTGGDLSLEVGNPALPVFNDLIEMPYGSNPTVKVLSYDEKIYKLSDLGIVGKIMPAQPHYFKDVDPSEIYFRYNENAYASDRFTVNSIAEVKKSGSSRGIDIANLTISPISYNPVKGEIKVLENLKIQVTYNCANTAKAIDMKTKSYSPYFEGGFSSLVNYKKVEAKDDLVTYPVTYLVVASDALESNAKLGEFIDWKTEKGFTVIPHFVSSSDSYTTIDTWIENQYNTLTPKPSFVLIVGDESGTYTVNTKSSGLVSGVSVSDLPYGVMGDISASNEIPSMYVGRFSVRSEADLTAQVDKTIWYEKTMFTSGADISYLANAMGVAGADGGHQATYGNPHILYAMDYYFNNTYQNPVTGVPVNITGIPYYDGGSGQASNIIGHVASGVAYYNYTAHGSQTSFADPGFQISDIDGLGNAGKYGLIIGNCCLTGSFATTECFGEAWLNAPNQGSVGFLGASASTQWDEDLAMGVGEVAIGNSTPVYSPEKPGMPDGLMMMNYPTQAGVRFVGLMAVENTTSASKLYYWEAYHTFGDPSLMPYVGIPSALTVTHAPTLTPGASTFEVTAQKNAYVALSDENGVLHGAAIANESGVANVPIIAFDPGTAKLVVTAQFSKPHFEDITVAVLDGPYDVLNNHSISNDTFGASVTANLELKNIGNQASNSAVLTAVSENTYISITDNTENFGNIASGDSTMKNNAIAFDIASNVPDQESIKVDLSIDDDYANDPYTASFTFKASAPALSIGDMTIDDSAGNGDGFIDPGETVVVSFPVLNDGHAETPTGTITLASPTSGISIATPVLNGTLDVGETVNAGYTITAAASMNAGDLIDLNLVVVGGAYTASKDIQTYISGTVIYPLDWAEDFNPMDSLWTTSVSGCTDKWEVSATNNAGGESPEIKLGWQSGAPSGVSRLITPALNTLGPLNNNSVTVNFKHYYNYYSTLPEIKLQVSNDGENWVDAGWTKVPTGDLTEDVSVTVTTNIATKTYFAWVLSGDMFEFDYWYIDDISIIGPAGIIYSNNTPDHTTLYQNYPNPFNPTTTINFFNKAFGKVNLGIYNAKGQLVENLVNKNVKAGYHTVDFNAAKFNSGVYFYMLKTANSKIVKKMLLVK